MARAVASQVTNCPSARSIQFWERLGSTEKRGENSSWPDRSMRGSRRSAGSSGDRPPSPSPRDRRMRDASPTCSGRTRTPSLRPAWSAPDGCMRRGPLHRGTSPRSFPRRSSTIQPTWRYARSWAGPGARAACRIQSELGRSGSPKSSEQAPPTAVTPAVKPSVRKSCRRPIGLPSRVAAIPIIPARSLRFPGDVEPHPFAHRPSAGQRFKRCVNSRLTTPRCSR